MWSFMCNLLVHTATATTNKVKFFCFPLLSQCEHHHLLLWYPIFLLLLPPWFGPEPIQWRHQNNEKYAVAVPVWTSSKDCVVSHIPQYWQCADVYLIEILNTTASHTNEFSMCHVNRNYTVKFVLKNHFSVTFPEILYFHPPVFDN